MITDWNFQSWTFVIITLFRSIVTRSWWKNRAMVNYVDSNPELHRFCISVLCDWSRKLHHPLSQSYAKLKPIATWVTRVFPRSRPVALVYIEVSLAPSAIFLCSDRPMWLTWFWFYDTQSKGALQLCFDIIVVVNWWCVGRTIYKRAQGKTVIFWKKQNALWIKLQIKILI